MDPLRLRVMKALTAALQEVTPANGYQNDFSQCVFRGRKFFGDGDPLPMISLLEDPTPLETIRSQVDNTDSGQFWEIYIQGVAPLDPLNPTDPAHVMMADTKMCLARQKKQFCPLKGQYLFGISQIDDMTIGAGTVSPADEVSAHAYFWMNLRLDIFEDLCHPYG